MPHKRNPSPASRSAAWRAWSAATRRPASKTSPLWHERDISHSSVERVILPDSTTLVDYLLSKTTNLIDTMFVYPERMLANLESTRGLIFSGQLLLDLVEHGVSREDAYRLVQAHAMRAWKEGLNFRELVLADKEITSRVPRKQIEYAFDLPTPAEERGQDLRPSLQRENANATQTRGEEEVPQISEKSNPTPNCRPQAFPCAPQCPLWCSAFNRHPRVIPVAHSPRLPQTPGTRPRIEAHRRERR